MYAWMHLMVDAGVIDDDDLLGANCSYALIVGCIQFVVTIHGLHEWSVSSDVQYLA